MQEVKEYCQLYELNTRIKFSIDQFWSPATEKRCETTLFTTKWKLYEYVFFKLIYLKFCAEMLLNTTEPMMSFG